MQINTYTLIIGPKSAVGETGRVHQSIPLFADPLRWRASLEQRSRPPYCGRYRSLRRTRVLHCLMSTTMGTSHTVQQGEHLTRIARQYGFLSYETIWNHPDNADLKQLRNTPNVLAPGDVLQIPDKQVRTESRATGSSHTFKVPARQLKLRIVVTDLHLRPLANTDCDFELEGQKKKVTTNGSGLIEETIPATAEIGDLGVADLAFDSQFKVGHLDPVDGESGQVGRLANLGYYRGSLNKIDEDELRSAIEEFQCDQKLKVTGICGPETQDKLKAVHGC